MSLGLVSHPPPPPPPLAPLPKSPCRGRVTTSIFIAGDIDAERENRRHAATANGAGGYDEHDDDAAAARQVDVRGAGDVECRDADDVVEWHRIATWRVGPCDVDNGRGRRHANARRAAARAVRAVDRQLDVERQLVAAHSVARRLRYRCHVSIGRQRDDVITERRRLVRAAKSARHSTRGMRIGVGCVCSL
jgi:hypothetical protein